MVDQPTPEPEKAPLRVQRRRRRVWQAAGILFSFCVLLNLFAFSHAYSLVHFQSGVPRTKRVERMTAGEKLWVLLTGVKIPKPRNRHLPARPYETRNTSFKGPAGPVSLESWYCPVDFPRGIVAMFHGYGGSKDDMVSESLALNELGFSTYLVDFYGSGGSSGITTSIGYHEAADIAAVWPDVSELSAGQPIFLYGKSMGSAAILRACKLYRLKPSAILIEFPFDRLITAIRNRFTLMGVPPVVLPELMAFWGGLQGGFSAFKHNPVEYAGAVKQPTLLMSGDLDRRVRPEESAAIFKALGGPKVHVRFPKAGHISLIKSDLELWKKSAGEFLSAYD